MSASSCCVLFTKPARPGHVKTRLIGRLSAGEAAALHDAFVADLTRRLSAGRFTLQIAWALEAGESLPAHEIPGFVQRGSDLGERLMNGLRHVARTHRRVAAIGSDHPEIPGEAVDRAFERLGEADVVIGPARDGGYYLIAVRSRSLDARLFSGVEWSTPSVLSQTLDNCARAGLRVVLLDEGDDVDSPDDLRRLADFLSAGAHDCPSTARLLDEWGLIR